MFCGDGKSYISMYHVQRLSVISTQSSINFRWKETLNGMRIIDFVMNTHLKFHDFIKHNQSLIFYCSWIPLYFFPVPWSATGVKPLSHTNVERSIGSIHWRCHWAVPSSGFEPNNIPLKKKTADFRTWWPSKAPGFLSCFGRVPMEMSIYFRINKIYGKGGLFFVTTMHEIPRSPPPLAAGLMEAVTSKRSWKSPTNDSWYQKDGCEILHHPPCPPFTGTSSRSCRCGKGIGLN